LGKLEIGVLSQLRKNFFGVRADFPNASLRVSLAARIGVLNMNGR
jgi:hypothetical protein